MATGETQRTLSTSNGNHLQKTTTFNYKDKKEIVAEKKRQKYKRENGFMKRLNHGF